MQHIAWNRTRKCWHERDKHSREVFADSPTFACCGADTDPMKKARMSAMIAA